MFLNRQYHIKRIEKLINTKEVGCSLYSSILFIEPREDHPLGFFKSEVYGYLRFHFFLCMCCFQSSL